MRPLPDALADTLMAPPDALIEAAVRLTTRAGMRITAFSPVEGYLETDWFDPERRRPVPAASLDVRRAVRLRFFADSVGLGHSQLVSEAVVRRSVDPSLPPRESEMMVPPEHPGFALLRVVLDTLHARFPEPAQPSRR
jgi:hypothetical protein